jgi:molybdenum-dependent DNA-binding transcriptional regulator ModE
MNLSKWIEKNGGINRAAKQLGVSIHRVYAWQAYACLPKAAMMRQIFEKTRGAVSYKELVDEYLDHTMAKKGASKRPRRVPKKKRKPLLNAIGTRTGMHHSAAALAKLVRKRPKQDPGF